MSYVIRRKHVEAINICDFMDKEVDLKVIVKIRGTKVWGVRFFIARALIVAAGKLLSARSEVIVEGKE